MTNISYDVILDAGLVDQQAELNASLIGDSGFGTKLETPVVEGKMPVATRERLGAVIIGDRLSVDDSGRISADEPDAIPESFILDL